MVESNLIFFIFDTGIMKGCHYIYFKNYNSSSGSKNKPLVNRNNDGTGIEQGTILLKYSSYNNSTCKDHGTILISPKALKSNC